MAKDYYQVLGVAKTATKEEIKKTYRKLAQKHHPDRNPGDKAAEERFKEITEAYAVLSDDDQRKQYDQFGDSGFHQRYSQEDIFRNVNINEVFRDFGFGQEDLFSRLFGGGGGSFHGGGRVRRPPPMKGANFSMNLAIPFRLAVTGGERRVEFRTEAGLEQLRVKIPQGIASGQRLRVGGKGGPSPTGGPAGDLFLDIEVEADAIFTRDGDDLLVTIRVPFSGLCLGTTAEVPTVSGANKRVKVPAGMQSGGKIRLRGEGINGGDLYALVEVDVPKAVTAEQKELLEQLEKVGL